MKAIALRVIEVERNYRPCGADRPGEVTCKCVDSAGPGFTMKFSMAQRE